MVSNLPSCYNKFIILWHQNEIRDPLAFLCSTFNLNLRIDKRLEWTNFWKCSKMISWDSTNRKERWSFKQFFILLKIKSRGLGTGAGRAIKKQVLKIVFAIFKSLPKESP